MELDELKYELNHKLETDHVNISHSAIAALLKKRTVSVIGKLKRSLRLEIAFCMIIIVVFGCIGIMAKQWSIRVYFSVFTVLFIAFMIVLVYLLQKTESLGNTFMPVRKNLQTVSHILHEFVKRCFQLTMTLIPVCFFLALLLSYKERPHIAAEQHILYRMFHEKWQVILFIALYMAVLTTGIYYFAKWYLKKLYGRYLSELQKCISELD